MELTVTIRRQASRTEPPYTQSFTLDTDPHAHTVLDLLNEIQWHQDGSLALRRNCRNVICGSCGMTINGRAGLACQKTTAEWLKPGESTLDIAPMRQLPVIRDLVVDMSQFWQKLERVDPYVDSQARQPRETLQTPAQRDRLQAAANCILCGSCYSACNAVEVNPQFVGPHALAKAARTLKDNRDRRTQKRQQHYDQPDFVWDCTRCHHCNEVCPVGVQPLDRITEIKQELLAHSPTPTPTPHRHRQSLIEFVAEDGWLDESKFGFQVVGDRGRDLKALWSLAPLGMRMIAKGKMPYPWQFRRSPAHGEIKTLMQRVLQAPSPSPDSETPSSAATPE